MAEKKKSGARQRVVGCLLLVVMGFGVLVWITVSGNSRTTRNSGTSSSPARNGSGVQQANAGVSDGPPAAEMQEAYPPPPAGYLENLVLAQTYAEAARRCGGVPVMRWKEDSIGVLPGTFQVIQVVGDMLLLSKLDREGFPGKTFFVSGISTANVADDETITLARTVCVFDGTVSYESLMGARTVHHVRVIDTRALRQAVDYLLARLRHSLARLEASRTGRVVWARKHLRMYEPVKHRTEKAAAKAAEARAVLEQFGDVTDEEMRAHKRERERIRREIGAAKDVLKWLRFPGLAK